MRLPWIALKHSSFLPIPIDNIKLSMKSKIFIKKEVNMKRMNNLCYLLLLLCASSSLMQAAARGGQLKKRFFNAVRQGNVGQVSKMLKNHPNLVNATNPGGNSPLIMATRKGNANMVELLLNAGADQQHKNERGKTAYDIANSDIKGVMDQHFSKMYQQMRQADKIPAGESQLGLSPGEFDSFIRLIQLGFGAQPLFTVRDKSGSVARVGLEYFFKELEKMLERLANLAIAVSYQTGKTGLLEAARSAKPPAWLNALINAGADVNHQDKLGNTALIGAARIGNKDAVELLLNAGADKNAKTIQGNTAADLASSVELKEFIETYGQ